MPSPFPGMDPYIEACGAWPVFHASFIAECSRHLNERLPDNYVATIGDRIELISDDDLGLVNRRPTGPDVNIVRNARVQVQPDAARDRGGTATLEPRILSQAIQWFDPPKQWYVQILHLPEQQVVTDLELLSPSNKRRGSEDRAAYLAKRQSLLRHQVNIVELDLLTGGERLKMLDPLPTGDYFAFVTRWQVSHQCEVYAWNMRDTLPTILAPLKREDGTIQLDLAAVFAATYQHGRFDRVIQYGEPPAALRDEDKRWAAERAASGMA